MTVFGAEKADLGRNAAEFKLLVSCTHADRHLLPNHNDATFKAQNSIFAGKDYKYSCNPYSLVSPPLNRLTLHEHPHVGQKRVTFLRVAT